jgi:hypothetical protein
VKTLYWSLAVLIIIAGCASSSNNNSQDYDNLISLQKPKEQPHRPSKVYIDSVKQVTINQTSALLIYGTFPDACTNLEEVTHRVENDSLYLNLKAWRNPETMCSQVLTPFSYIYDNLGKQDFASHSEIIINDTAFSF